MNQTTMLLAVLALGLAACGTDSPANGDGGALDAGPRDLDAGPRDPDAGPLPDAGPNDGGVAVQMNDVSILLPLAVDGGHASDLLAASDVGAYGVLFPEALYDAAGHVIGSHFDGPPAPGSVGVALYSDLHVVAVRIDPCFASLAPDPHGAGCDNQLRVVLQEVTDEGGEPSANDSALHVFYRLDRDELVGVARELVAIRQTSGVTDDEGPLAPNPIVAREGLNGPFASRLRALVLQHAGASRLIRVTEMSANDQIFSWAFRGFDVTDATAPAMEPMIIPTLPDAGITQAFSTGFSANSEMRGVFSPSTISADDLTTLANVDTADALDDGGLHTAFDALLRVENPGRNSPNTIDCASCHLATPAEQFIAGPRYGLAAAGNANAFAADARFVPAADLATTLDLLGSPNIHAFSYVGQAPGINQRTVNETAAIVAYLNTLP